MVRLGQGVDRPASWPTRRWRGPSPRSTSTPRCSREHGVPPERIRFCATSATRDAAQRGRLRRRRRARGSGSRRRCCPATRRRALAFAGAMRDAGRRCRPRRCWSSTSAAARPSWSSATGRVRAAPTSMDIGSVRLHERHLHSRPADRRARSPACVRRHRRAHLDALPGSSSRAAATVVGVAGTVTTVARRRPRPAGVRPRRDRPAPCSRSRRRCDVRDRLVAMTRRRARARCPTCTPAAPT